MTTVDYITSIEILRRLSRKYGKSKARYQENFRHIFDSQVFPRLPLLTWENLRVTWVRWLE